MRNFIVCTVCAEREVRCPATLVVGGRKGCSLYDWERVDVWPAVGPTPEKITAFKRDALGTRRGAHALPPLSPMLFPNPGSRKEKIVDPVPD